MPELKIGQVASLVRVGVDTVRYYERLGLLPQAPRRASGYRVFDDTTVDRIRLIKELQDLGLTLDEIDAMLRAVGDHASTCEHESSKIRNALARTDEKIAALAAVRDRLANALARCGRRECTIVDRVARIASKPRTRTKNTRSTQ